MKKSEILRILGRHVKNHYKVGPYLYVQIDCLDWAELDALKKWMLGVDPVDKNTIEISFDSSVDINN